MKDYSGRETIDNQVQQLKYLLEEYSGKVYKKDFNEFRKDMKFGNRFSDKYRLKYHILKLVEEIKLDKKFIINEPIFDYTDNTITLYAEIIKPDVEKKMEQEQKALKEKIDNEAPKLNQYEWGVTYTLKSKTRFGRTVFKYYGSKNFKAYTETEASNLFKKFIEDEIKHFVVMGNRPIEYEYFFSDKTPIEPYK